MTTMTHARTAGTGPEPAGTGPEPPVGPGGPGGPVGPVVEVTGGVDTHKDTHTAAAVDGTGRLLGTRTFPATPAGYRALLGWLHGFETRTAGPAGAGPGGARRLGRVGVEGTGSYGAGLARHLHTAGVEVVEVDRPDRTTRRRRGKSDPIDAVAAARATLAETATGTPKHRDGPVEALRMLRVARRAAVKTRAEVQTQIKNVVIAAPDTLRARLGGLTDPQLIATCAGFRPDHDRVRRGDPDHAARASLHALAHLHQHLTTEITRLDADLDPLVHAINPALLQIHGVGTDTAGQLLVTAGDNPDRIRSDAAFAMLCGAAPIPASSGKTTGRHRLNRGGDRHANAALHRIAITRMRWHQPTRDYVTRRTTEGLTKKDILRCLKRYIAREIYTTLHTTPLDHP